MLEDADAVDKGLRPAVDIQDRLPTLEEADARDKASNTDLNKEDRLPMIADAEVTDEGSETAVVENVDPLTGVVKGEKTTMVHRFRNPFVGSDFGFSLNSMKKSMKDVMGECYII